MGKTEENMRYHTLLLGSGGREHALALKLAEGKHIGELYIMPGNPGTAECGTNIQGDINNFEFVKKVVLEHSISMLVVGPEAPLVGGIADFFRNDPLLSEVLVVGPGSDGAKLEGSKAFAKDFMARHAIPTASYRSFTASELKEAFQFLEQLSPPYVIKADGLAAGKGVTIYSDILLAKQEVEDILAKGKFGLAGNGVVIEKFIEGIELSVFVFTDGTRYVLLPEAKDYKRIGEGDIGPNTGGMGSVSPVPFFTEELRVKVEEKIIDATLKGLQAESIPYFGFIFFGLMISEGEPYVIEYNVRLGDPEAESVLPRISSDISEMILFMAGKNEGGFSVQISEFAAATVMLVSEGYPGNYPKGRVISGVEKVSESVLFHAGTKLDGKKLVTSGGRVMGVTSAGESINDALIRSYMSAKLIEYEGKNYRGDIGFDL